MVRIKNRHMMIGVSLVLGLASLLGLMGLLDVRPVSADNWTVTNTNDSGAGSLRAAIVSAADGDTIDFASALNGQTISLTSGALAISKNLTINGPGANLLAISGNNSVRVFHITATVTISGATVRDGGGILNGGIWNVGTLTLINSTVVSNTLISGGGIFNLGTLELINSIVVSNTADFVGGGIFNLGTMTISGSTITSNTVQVGGGGIANIDGTVTIISSTVTGNTAEGGGGIVNSNVDGTMTIISSTIAGNTAVNYAGGIDNNGTMTMTNSTVAGNTAKGGGGFLNQGILSLTSSTVTSNTARTHGGGIKNLDGTISLNQSTVASNTAVIDGGGLFLDDQGRIGGGTILVANSILGGNQATGAGNDCTLISGTLTSGGYNLVQSPDASCVFAATGDITGVNPLLAPLADNGGGTLTQALLPGSPAIDKIPNGSNGCGTTITADQRGINRPLDGDGDSIAHCDFGAYEFVQPSVAEFAGTPTSGLAPLIVSLTNLSSGEFDSCSWTFGDGQSSNFCSEPSHTYTVPGSYTVTLTVSGLGGIDSEVKPGYIEVQNYRAYLPFVLRAP